MADVPPVPARPDDLSEVFAVLLTEAAAFDVVFERFAIKAFNALGALQGAEEYPDWTPVDRLGAHLSHITRMASQIEREYAVAPRRLPRIAPALRVVR